MKKSFVLEDLDCAHCAAKMENGIREIPGVKNCTVSYLAQKLTIEADDELFDGIVKKAVKICKRIEPDCTIITD